LKRQDAASTKREAARCRFYVGRLTPESLLI
jgi:hypothetical protein